MPPRTPPVRTSLSRLMPLAFLFVPKPKTMSSTSAIRMFTLAAGSWQSSCRLSPPMAIADSRNDESTTYSGRWRASQQARKPM